MLTSEHKIKVYLKDTDSYNVYHTAYLDYMEAGRSELIGIEKMNKYLKNDQIAFVLYKIEEVVFKGALEFGDTAIIKTEAFIDSNGFQIIFKQNIYKNEKLVTTGKFNVVCIKKGRIMLELPEEIERMFGKN